MKYTKLKITHWLSLLTGAVFCVLQTILYLRCYEEGVHLYNAGFTAYHAVYLALFAVMAALFAVTVCTKPEHYPAEQGACGKSASFFALLSALLLGAGAIHALYILLQNGSMPSILRLIAMLLAFPAAFYFAVTAWGRQPRRRVLAFLCMLVIIWASVYLMACYFEMNTSINSPERVLRQMSLVALLLHTLYETRYLLEYPIPRLYFGTGCVAVILPLCASLPDVIVTFMGHRAVSADTMFSMALSAISLYYFCRVGNTLSGPRACYAPEEPSSGEENADRS